MRRILIGSLCACVLAGLLAGGARPALPDVVLGFDDLAPGQLTTQLRDRGGAGQGVVFGSPLDYGFAVTDGAIGPGLVKRFACNAPFVESSAAARSPGRVAALGCGTEFASYGTFGVLPRWRSKLTAFVRVISANVNPGSFVLTAYDYRRNPIATRSVDTASGGGWQQLTVTDSKPSIAYFALYWNRLEAGGLKLALDDLTYDQPETPPAPQISISRQDGSRPVIVHQGQTAAVDFTITRWNGSVGNVALSPSSLHPEVDAASFAPNPANGSSTRLTVHARVNAAFDGDVATVPTSTVTATPLSAAAGSTADSHSFPLGVLPVFGFRPVQAVDLPPCTPTTIQTGLSVAPGFAQQIGLRAAVSPALVDAALAPATFTPGFSGVSEVKLLAAPAWATSLADAVLTITATSAGYPTRQARITLRRSPIRIESVVADLPGRTIPVTELRTQRYLQPPQRIVIRGVGFCPGTTVQFGNKHAIAKPVSVSPDGTRIVVDVPRLATDGPLTVIGPAGTRVATSASLPVRTYRNENGYAFANRKGREITWGEFVDVFGYEQTHLSIDACPWLPGVKCEVTTPFPSPLAVAFYLFSKNVATKGLCFGMGVSSLRLMHGYLPLSDFQPGARTVWQLPAPTGPSPALSDLIHRMHLLQHSLQLTAYRRAGYASARGFRDALDRELRRGEAAIVGFRSGEAGHAIVAYDIEERGGGSFDVLAYNPNDPYTRREADASDAAADAHKRAEDQSTLQLDADGTWSFPELGWTGGPGALYVIPYSAIPSEPRLPSNLAELWYFAASGSAEVAQVTDEDGKKLLTSGGRQGRPDIPGAAVLAPLDSRDGPNPTLLLPAGRRYSVALRGRGTGPYTAGFFNGRLTALVQGQVGDGGALGQATFDARSGALGVRGGGSRGVAATLVASAGDGSLRTATLRTKGAASAVDTIAFDRARGTVTVRHAGPPATISLELGWTGRSALPTAVTTPAVQVRSGDALTVTARRWPALGREAVTITKTARSGSKVVRRLRGVAGPIVAVRSVALAAQPSRKGTTLSLAARLRGSGVASGQATVLLVVLRGKRVVAQYRTSVSAARLARPVVWRTRRLAPGRYTLAGAVSVFSGQGRVAGVGVSRGTRITLNVR